MQFKIEEPGEIRALLFCHLFYPKHFYNLFFGGVIMNVDGIIDVFLGHDVINDEENLQNIADELRKELNYAKEQHKLTTPVVPVNVYDVTGIKCGICPRCTMGVNNGDRFCHNCGAELDWSSIVH
jgi:hypothetical protein